MADDVRVKVIDQAHGEGWSAYLADSVDAIRGIPDSSVGLSFYSPPFSHLYCYSDSDRDLGNCVDDEQFLEGYRFLADELLRITKPGRLAAVHCKDLVDYKGSDGRAGLRDFPGELIRVHEEVGWKLHSKVTVWRCPVNEMRKTKAHGLLYKQLRTDSTFSRQGLPEYVLVFRKWAGVGDAVEPVTHTKETFPLPQWQQWASPVWMDDDAKDVLNVQVAREREDEKHLCPLPLGLIRRCVLLWSNPGDVVFSPFGGIGSEGYQALREGRKAIIMELKRSYFDTAVRNLENACRQLDLFAGAAQ
jgi:DNA modification methylase